jgi:hypothetical protein
MVGCVRSPNSLSIRAWIESRSLAIRTQYLPNRYHIGHLAREQFLGQRFDGGRIARDGRQAAMQQGALVLGG